MSYSIVSQHRKDRRLGGLEVYRLSLFGVSMIFLAVPGVVRLFYAPSASLAFLSAVTLGFLLSARFYCRRAMGRLQVERNLPLEARSRERFTVELRISIERGSTVTGVVLSDSFFAGETDGEPVFYLPVVAPGSWETRVYRAVCTTGRGWLSFQGIYLTVQDPLGIMSLSGTRPLFSDLLLLPCHHELQQPDLSFPGAQASGPRNLVLETGRGDEFCGIREYRPGDRVRDIHWRATARLGIPVVREHFVSLSPAVRVLLHLYRPRPRATGEEEMSAFGFSGRGGSSVRRYRLNRSIDLCVEAAAVLVEWGAAAGFDTSLHIVGLQPVVEENIRTSASALGALRQLALAKPQSSMSLADALGGLVSGRNGSSLLVVAPLSSLWTQRDRAAVLELQGRGTQVGLFLCFPESRSGVPGELPEHSVFPGTQARLFRSPADLPFLLTRSGSPAPSGKGGAR